METKVKHDQRNHIQNDRTLKVDGSQSTTIGKGRTTQITTGNEVKTVLAGSDLETISLLKSTTAKEIFEYAQDRIELEVGKQTNQYHHGQRENPVKVWEKHDIDE